MTKRVCFLTTNDFGFGGSEDLWTATALAMAADGWQVGISVRHWDPLPAALATLIDAGCSMMWHGTPGSGDDFAKILDFDPQLVVVSQGFQLEGIEWHERLIQNQMPFIVINQCVHEAGWPALNDAQIDRLVELHQAAREFLFVSEANRELYERMAGIRLKNAAVVRNPFKVDYDVSLPWPQAPPLQLATVGRLECYHKGYDLLLEALSAPKWQNRAIELHLYGDGPHRRLLGRLAERSGFPAVRFHGHVSDITAVWRRHHVLVQPSRLEGLPLSVVEAMLCGRVVVATDVAGHREVVTDNISGFLARAATVELLDEALQRMWDQKDYLEAMGGFGARNIRRLVPRNPAGDFAQRIAHHVSEAASSLSGSRPVRPTVSVSPKLPHRADEHQAQVYFAEDGMFSETAKVAATVPYGIWVTLRFAGLRGQVRFDPGVRPGLFHVRRVAFPGADGPGMTVTGTDLANVLTVGGTAVLQSCSEEGLVLLSHGDDPIIAISKGLTSGNAPFSLEIELCGK